jgi:hypothetical protein
MKYILPLGVFALIFVLTGGTALSQTVPRTYNPTSSVSIDGVGNFGSPQPEVTFTNSDFTDGCLISDVDVLIRWTKTAGTCGAPTAGASLHQETSFQINGPAGGTEVLAVAGTWSGNQTIGGVTTTFSTGGLNPTGTPVTGTFDPNNGNLANYNGTSAAGPWSLDIGDNLSGAPVCLDLYTVIITTAPDVTPPVLTVPANITVNADQGSCATTVTFAPPTATDLCDAGLTIVQTAGSNSGSIFNVGATTITFEATDDYNNSSTESFTITVVDTQDPVITCPGTVFAGCNTTVNYPLPTATDNCPAVTVSVAPGSIASGGTFPPGTTSVTYDAEDAAGNTASCTFDVLIDTESTEPTSITASATVACAGAPVTLTVNGGTLGTNAQWLWYIGACGGQLVGSGATIVVNPLSTANYFVRAEGPCNATACVNVVIDVTAAPSLGFGNIAGPSACGAADGSITAVASGGAPPYTYTWTNGSVGSTISGLSAGPYEVTVTDATGCTDFSSISLNDPGASEVFLSSSNPLNTICEGESVTFTATGAFQYQYYIDGVPVSTQNPFTTNSLQDGQTVYVVGTDFNFCSYTTQGIVHTVFEVPGITETVSDPSACATPDGVIQTSVSGGLPPYSYSWSNTEITPNISGLFAGPYALTVTDDNGCSSTETYALNDPGALPVSLASSEDPTNEICDGESVTFSASGSVDYEFFINGQSVSTTNPYVTASLVDGESVVATGTDGANCTATSNIIYPIVNPGPIVTLVADDADTTICVGETISFFAAGGIVYEFFVDGVSQGAPSSTTVFVTSSITNGQVVSVIATDANQCGVESTGIPVTVSDSPTISIVSFTDPSACGATDGVITAEASGGTPSYTYAWGHGPSGPTVATLNAGSYFVEVTDDAGCTASTSQSLSDVGSSPTTLTSTATNSTICGGDEVTFTGSGASTYIFYVNGVEVTTQNPFVTDSLIDGDIIAVLGLDTQLCAATSAPETYIVHPEIEVGIISFVNPSACGAADGFANAITIGGVPAYQYNWTPTAQAGPVAVGLSAGQYSVTITDANGCSSTDVVSISDPGSLTVSIDADPTDFTICDGTPIEFTASGADTYEFFIDGASVGSANPYLSSVITDGQTIAAVGTDLSSCTATSPGLSYNVLSVPTVSLSFPAIACTNEELVELVGGSPLGGFYTVDYNGFPIVGDLFFPDLAGEGAINVDYTFEAANGCDATASANYNVLLAPQIDLGNDTTVCVITLDAGGGYISYDWTNGEVSQTVLTDVTALYEVVVVDANGCIGTDAISVIVNPIPDPVITPGGTLEFCVGDTVTLTGEAGFNSYAWSPTADITETTEWYQSDTVVLTVTNQFGCEGTSAVVLVANMPMPISSVTADGPLEFCVGESVNLSADPGYASYLWNSGSTTQTVNVIESGDYWPTVLDGNGCIDSSLQSVPVTVTVWTPNPLVLESGDSLIMTNSGDFVSYQWFYGAGPSNMGPIQGATDPTYVITQRGYYQVCVVDANGCEGCSFVYEMTCCVGIEEVNFDGNVSVYPNPNNGQFTVEVEMARQMNMTVGLYDMVGKQVWLDEGLGNTSSLRKQYDLSHMPDGVYFLRIYADNQMTVQKLIKQQ